MKALILLAALTCPAMASPVVTEQPPGAEAPLLEWLPVHNPWADTAEPAPPPRPYKLPRMGGPHGDHYSPIPPLKTAPAIDADGLYRSILACYPEKSKFKLDVELQTSFTNRATYDYTGTAIGQHYIGIVARMPIYSVTELNRERAKEHSRRVDTAATVGALMTALASRNHALRELGLYSSLEARAQIRVAQGVSETAEQVGYLERVAMAQKALITAQAGLVQQRLSLISQCADDKAGPINTYIQRLLVLPQTLPVSTTPVTATTTQAPP